MPGVFSGGYSQAAAEREQQSVSNQRERNRLRNEQKRLHGEQVRRREKASSANAKRSKRGIAAKDSDARERIDRARLSGKDGRAGQLLKQLEGRANHLNAALANTSVEKHYTSGIWLDGGAAKRNSLIELPAGFVPLGGERQLAHPALRLGPVDRVALTGPNGVGKSTLIAKILAHCELEAERLVVLPQEFRRIARVKYWRRLATSRVRNWGR